jgi:HD-GYP domain-containing protein (c-di-GMP phosphodiesterase class II)
MTHERGVATGGSGQPKQLDLRQLHLLGTFLERRLTYLQGWSKKTRLTAVTIGRAGRLDRRSLGALATGSSFHDLGLLAIPDGLLEAKRALTREERQVVDRHVRYGRELISLAFSDNPEILNIVLFHHERPDGQGPLGLAGDMIPPLAKIVSVSDAVVAMQSGRPHRPPLSPDEIMTTLKEGAGTQFDAAVVRTVEQVRSQMFASLASLAAGRDGSAPATLEPRSSADTVSSGSVARQPDDPDLPAASRKMRGSVDDHLDRITSLSALPTPVCEVIALASNTETERTELVKAVQQDVALSGKLMTVANSAAFRRRERRFQTLDEAIGALGFSTVASVAASMSVLRGSNSSQSAGLDFARLWGHSLACGAIARALSSREDARVQDARFLHALMHDLGKFVIAECFSHYIEFLAGTSTFQEEVALLGLDHAKLGARMMLKWEMPSELTRACREHHCNWDSTRDWTAEGKKDVLIVQLADALAIALGFDSGFLDYLPRIPQHVLAECPAVHDLDIAAVANSVDEELQQLGRLLGVGWPRPEHAAWARASADENLPRLTYVTPTTYPVDPVAVWLQQANALLLDQQTLDEPASESEVSLPLVIHLPSGPVSGEAGERLETILARHSGLLIAAEQDCRRLLQQSSGKWRSVQLPIAIRDLGTKLNAARAALTAAVES